MDPLTPSVMFTPSLSNRYLLGGGLAADGVQLNVNVFPCSITHCILKGCKYSERSKYEID